jgi:hypothetical protein
MVRKNTRNCSSLRSTASFIAVFSVGIALTALAQTTGNGQRSGKTSVAPVKPNPSALVLARGARAELGPMARSMNQSRVGVKGPGAPLFVPAVTYDSGGISALSLAVSDVNGDGFPDIVVANNCADDTCSEGSVGVLLGNGDGTFRPVVTYGSGGQSAEAVAIADLNGDGKPDLVVTNCGLPQRCPPDGGVGSIGVLLGNGDGTFRTAVTYLSGGTDAMSIAIADVNKDGKPDLLVTNFESATVGELLGNGDGTFQAVVLYPAGGVDPFSIAVSDVNGDGKLDLVVAEVGVINGLSGYVAAVLLGNGDGTFQPAVLYFSGGCGALAVAVADVSGDGKPDIMIGNASLGSDPTGCSGGDGVVSVLLGNGDGTFQPATTYDTGGSEAFSVGIGDINGDGHPDLTVADFLSGGVGVLLGNGDGTFQPVMTFSPGPNGARSVAVVDLNGDHRPDVVAATCCTGVANHGEVGVLLNNTGPHSPTTTELTSSLNPAPPKKVVTYSATVIPQSGQAAGTVTFQDGSSMIATVTLVGNKAAYSTSYKSIGVHLITATYSGDLHNASSTSSTLTEDVQGTSKTIVASSGSPSLVGQSVTFTATVTSNFGNIPDGELVTFYDGATKIGTGVTGSGVATFATSSLSAKTHSIKAKYTGDTIFKPSSGTVKQVVGKFSTMTALISNLNPSQLGQAVTFTAQVTSTGPSIPTGKVKFLDGSATIGSAMLSGGVTKLTKSNLAVGTHPISAQYLGDAESDESASSVVNQVVQ